MNRKSALTPTHDKHDVYGGKAFIRRTSVSGGYWQFYMWFPGETQMYRKSLRTRDLQSAMALAEEQYLDLHHQIKSGKKLFGVTLNEIVRLYVDRRQMHIGGKIGVKRHSCIKTQLKGFVRFKGPATHLSELERDALFDYAEWRRAENIQPVTIRHEQSTINAMMQFAYQAGYTHFDKFEFDKLKIKEVGRRDSFTATEFAQLYRYMESWCSDENAAEGQLYERRLMQDCILFASSSMLRVGEFRQMRWKDVRSFDYDFDEHKKRVLLVTINVRAETSKTRKARLITTLGGEFLKRLKARTPFKAEDDYIFHGGSGVSKLSEKRCNKEWANLMSAIGIDYRSRNLTWYSLRHFAISRSLAAGNSIFEVAKVAGTSSTYIEQHYAHIDQAMSRRVALKVCPDGDFNGVVPIFGG